MGDAGPPSVAVIKVTKVEADPEAGATYVDLAGSSPWSKAPVVAGVWSVADFEDPPEGSDFEAEWDEVKYVISGEAIWSDVTAGRERHDRHVKKGDLIWIPKGSKSSLRKTRDFTTVYVEQTYRDLKESQNQIKPSLSALRQQLLKEYAIANPKSKASFEEACKYLPGGNTRSVLYYDPFPLTLASGRGCHVTSLDSREYLDCVSEFTAGFFGHSHPDIHRAGLEAFAKGINLGGHIQEEIELSRHLVSRFKSIEQIRFCNSGTEANTFAIAVGKSFSKKEKVLVFQNAYHGGSLTFTDNCHPMTLPHKYVWGTFNDIESTRKVIDSEIGVIIVEPMQGAGGLVVGTNEFIRYLRATADKIGAILIFDEVITSRLHYGGLQEHYGVYPDMTTLGKYIGGGFSFGAFGGRKEIMEKLDPRLSREDGGIPHSGTYNNNIFTMKAGLAAAKLVTAESIGRCNQLGDALRDGIRNILRQRHIDCVKAVGFGSLVGIHFEGPDAVILRDVFFFWMLKQGIWSGRRGFMNLNLTHQECHVHQILEALESFADLLG